MKKLTDRQSEIYDFIISHIKWEGYPPTIRQIGEHFSIASPNGVKDHLLALERKGQIRLHPRASRGGEGLADLAEILHGPVHPGEHGLRAGLDDLAGQRQQGRG